LRTVGNGELSVEIWPCPFPEIVPHQQGKQSNKILLLNSAERNESIVGFDLLEVVGGRMVAQVKRGLHRGRNKIVPFAKNKILKLFL
jgi:hypothetical protein